MPVVGVKPGDFVEFRSLGNTDRLFKGVLTHLGWIGSVQPYTVKPQRQVGFVDIHDGRRPFLVGADRLRKSNGFAIWLNSRGAGAA